MQVCLGGFLRKGRGGGCSCTQSAAVACLICVRASLVIPDFSLGSLGKSYVELHGHGLSVSLALPLVLARCSCR